MLVYSVVLVCKYEIIQRTHYTYNTLLTLWSRDKMAAIFETNFLCIFLNENIWSLLDLLVKFVPNGPVNNIPSLVQIMDGCRPGDKQLLEPMMVCFLTYICVTRPRWVKHNYSNKLLRTVQVSFIKSLKLSKIVVIGWYMAMPKQNTWVIMYPPVVTHHWLKIILLKWRTTLKMSLLINWQYVTTNRHITIETYGYWIIWWQMFIISINNKAIWQWYYSIHARNYKKMWFYSPTMPPIQ